METKTEIVLPSNRQMIDSGECLLCPNCCNKEVLQQWTNLAAICRIGNLPLNMLIYKFIITLDEPGGICYTHPENLPGTKKDGSNAHYFYKSMNAYASGKRKRRKIQSENSVRWHKTGKTRPVMENGVTKGYKKILVLYNSVTNGCKPVKSNWVMHQYHLGTKDNENDGEYVVCKVFYQQRHVKKVDNPVSKEDSVHPVKDISSTEKKKGSNTNNDIKIDIVRTHVQEMEIIENIHHPSPSGSQSIFETEFPSLFAGEICKPSSTFKEDIISKTAGMTELENIRVDTPVDSDLFEDLMFFLDDQYDWDDQVHTEHNDNDVTSHRLK